MVVRARVEAGQALPPLVQRSRANGNNHKLPNPRNLINFALSRKMVTVSLRARVQLSLSVTLA